MTPPRYSILFCHWLNRITVLFRLLPVLCLCLVLAIPAATAEEDPVVLQVGETVLKRSEFEHQFGMAMVITAVRAGLPIKSGVQIRDLRERYLENRVTELLLLQKAHQQGLQVSEAELQTETVDFLQQIEQQYGADRLTGFEDSRLIEDYLGEQLLIRKVKDGLLKQNSVTELNPANSTEHINKLTDKYRQATVVHTYPDRL